MHHAFPFSLKSVGKLKSPRPSTVGPCPEPVRSIAVFPRVSLDSATPPNIQGVVTITKTHGELLFVFRASPPSPPEASFLCEFREVCSLTIDEQPNDISKVTFHFSTKVIPDFFFFDAHQQKAFTLLNVLIENDYNVLPFVPRQNSCRNDTEITTNSTDG